MSSPLAQMHAASDEQALNIGRPDLESHISGHSSTSAFTRTSANNHITPPAGFVRPMRGAQRSVSVEGPGAPNQQGSYPMPGNLQAKGKAAEILGEDVDSYYSQGAIASTPGATSPLSFPVDEQEKRLSTASVTRNKLKKEEGSSRSVPTLDDKQRDKKERNSR
jgi:hypothetical protein